ncbi:hypothetical protein [Pyxidicoccus xibeiensis]|uniref:hypothetical protein n=1 Tax=Pyxidicoccus xibeiensis TaxID=2906759 RepID=UPI0020A7BDB3|nr:hypothetical protein [Pyxidicoccus xibeiensis]MCP3142337.1 hypothetical protein [Pyxidicoccus xibeiensis]
MGWFKQRRPEPADTRELRDALERAQGELTSTRRELGVVTSDDAADKARIAELEARLTQARQELGVTTADDTTDKARIAELEAQLAREQDALQNLETQRRTLESSVERLTGQLQQLERRLPPDKGGGKAGARTKARSDLPSGRAPFPLGKLLVAPASVLSLLVALLPCYVAALGRWLPIFKYGVLPLWLYWLAMALSWSLMFVAIRVLVRTKVPGLYSFTHRGVECGSQGFIPYDDLLDVERSRGPWERLTGTASLRLTFKPREANRTLGRKALLQDNARRVRIAGLKDPWRYEAWVHACIRRMNPPR